MLPLNLVTSFDIGPWTIKKESLSQYQIKIIQNTSEINTILIVLFYFSNTSSKERRLKIYLIHRKTNKHKNFHMYPIVNTYAKSEITLSCPFTKFVRAEIFFNDHKTFIADIFFL